MGYLNTYDNYQLEVAKNRGYLAYHPRGHQSLKQAIDAYDLLVMIFDLIFLLLEKFMPWVLKRTIEKS